MASGVTVYCKTQTFLVGQSDQIFHGKLFLLCTVNGAGYLLETSSQHKEISPVLLEEEHEASGCGCACGGTSCGHSAGQFSLSGGTPAPRPERFGRGWSLRSVDRGPNTASDNPRHRARSRACMMSPLRWELNKQAHRPLRG